MCISSRFGNKEVISKDRILKKHLFRGLIIAITAEIPKRKKIFIQEELADYDNLLSVKELCEIAGISRFNYYYYLLTEKERYRAEDRDRKDFEIILDAYNYKGCLKGSRAIKMHLNKNDNCINSKKIQILMNKYKLVCYVREANPYRRMQKAKKTSIYAKNRAQRNWGNFGPG